MPADRLWTFAALSGLIVAGVLVVRDGAVAVMMAREDVAGAARLASSAVNVAAGSAAQALLDGDQAAAVRSATEAVVRAPLRAQNVRLLARAYADAGDAERSGQLLAQAGALGWRDTPTQFILLASAMAQGDALAAADRADALGRRKERLPEAYTALRLILRMPGGPQAVADRLAERPLYRAEFLGQTEPLSADDLAPREALYAAMAGTMAPPSTDEVLPYVTALAKRGEHARARSVWIRLGDAGGEADRSVQDPGFARIRLSESGYGWQAREVEGINLQVEDKVDRTSATLKVDGNGRGSGRVIEQSLVLSPGAHTFQLWRRDGDARAADAFRWTLRCGRDGADLLASPLPVRPSGGKRLSLRFVVPAGCPAQGLALEARPIDPAGEVTSWFQQPAIR